MSLQRVAGAVILAGALAMFVLLVVTNLTPDPKRFLSLSGDGLCEVLSTQLAGCLICAAACGVGAWWLAGSSVAARFSSIGVVVALLLVSWLSLQPDSISSLGFMGRGCPTARFGSLIGLGVLVAFCAAVLAWPAPSARGP